MRTEPQCEIWDYRLGARRGMAYDGAVKVCGLSEKLFDSGRQKERERRRTVGYLPVRL